MKANDRNRAAKANGFSVVELVIAVAIALVLSAIALPTMTSSIQAYRLSSATRQVANVIDIARFTAIRRNTLVSLQMIQQGPNTVFYVDANGSGTLDLGETEVLLPSDMQRVNGQLLVPAAATTGLANTVDFVNQITFDSRGTVSVSCGAGCILPATTNAFLAIGYANQVQSGFRGISVNPMGLTRVWTSQSRGGYWTAQ